MLRAAFIALAANILAPAALAQPAFVPIEVSDDEITFVDVGEIKREGEELELSVLEFQTRNQSDPIAYVAMLTTFRYSCDWNTYVRLDYVYHLPDGSVTRDNTLRRGGPPFFFGPGGWHAAVGPIVCDASVPRPLNAFPSIATTIAEGGRATKRRPPPTPGAPPTVYDYTPPPPFTMPNFPTMAASRLGLVYRDPVSGNAQYLDWGNLVRKDNTIHAITVEALGVTKPGPVLFGRLKQSSVDINCAAGTATVLAYVDFDGALRKGYPQIKAWPTRTAQNWALGGLLMEMACDGKEPDQTLRSLDDVLQTQRQKPGTSPPPPG